MATGNTRKLEAGNESTNQDSYLISASCRILQDLTDIYINPEESIFVDEESAHLPKYLNSETPNKYPNAPHSSPIDLQNDPESSIFNTELVKCLNELPVILLSLEERRKHGSEEIVEFDAEDPPESFVETSTSTESDDREKYQYQNENFGKNCPVKAITVTSSNLAENCKDESTDALFTNVNSQLEKINLLRVDSFGEFNKVFNKRSNLSDNASLIVNYSSDASDLSLEDVESVSSDDSSSCASREIEALALDSTNHPSTAKIFQHWRTRVRNKRALSLDEMSPSKIMHTDIFATPFELTI